MQPGNTAVITGGASGIGLACAQRFAALGMSVCIADLGETRLERAAQEIIALVPDAQNRVLTVQTDVRKREDLEHLESLVTDRFGGTDVLMNNAAISGRGDVFGLPDYWQDVLATNLWGVIQGTQVFVPKMIAVFVAASLTASFVGGKFSIFTQSVYARIEQGIQQVDHHVDDDETDRRDNHDRLQHRCVLIIDGFLDQPANAVQAEDSLGDDRSAQQLAK